MSLMSLLRVPDTASHISRARPTSPNSRPWVPFPESPSQPYAGPKLNFFKISGSVLIRRIRLTPLNSISSESSVITKKKLNSIEWRVVVLVLCFVVVVPVACVRLILNLKLNITRNLGTNGKQQARSTPT